MRRNEFDCRDLEIVSEVLREAKIGHLAFLRQGELELLPFNFTYDGEHVYFHGSPKTGLAGAVGQSVKFLSYKDLAWIPSTWRHPELACPATTYFCSLSLKSELVEVHSLQEKAKSLEGFMRKYQPEDPYLALSDPRYEKPLKALFVGRIKRDDFQLKLKMGQHLTKKQCNRVYENLLQRQNPGDREVARMMMRANPGRHVYSR